MTVTVDYYRVDFDKYDDLSDLVDPDFLKENGELFRSHKVSTREEFEELENEYWQKEDAAYPRIISGYFDNLKETIEITTGTAGMLEDWEIVEYSYEDTAEETA